MKKKDLASIIFVLILGGLLAYLWLTPSGHPTAPAVSFKDLQNKEFSLQDLHDKPVVINFWATECPGCVNEIPLLVNMYKQHSQDKLLIIGVAMGYDPESQVREMVKQKKMNYPIVLDSNDSLVKAFNIKVTPTTLFISKEGKIMQRKLGEMSHDEFATAVAALIH